MIRLIIALLIVGVGVFGQAQMAYSVGNCAVDCILEASVNSNCGVEVSGYGQAACACSSTGVASGAVNSTVFLRSLNICLVRNACASKDVVTLAAFHAKMCSPVGYPGAKLEAETPAAQPVQFAPQTQQSQPIQPIQPIQQTQPIQPIQQQAVPNDALAGIMGNALPTPSTPPAQNPAVNPSAPSRTNSILLVPQKTPSAKPAVSVGTGDALYQLPTDAEAVLQDSMFAPQTNVKDPLKPITGKLKNSGVGRFERMVGLLLVICVI